MKPRRGKRPDRAGYALVLFVMMFFGLMGLAALVIDMGFARLAQRQMQTAVDSAALEGLRFRSDCPDQWLSDPAYGGPAPPRPTTPYNDADPQWQQWLAWLDSARRVQASNTVANLFTDYVDPNTGETVHYGAGPVVNFSGGIGPTELAASQLMQPRIPPVYQPVGLELNTGNAKEGDMVAGTYGQNNVDPPSGPADEGTTAADSSGNPYHRRDFQNTLSQAFLVRMRRTSDTSSFDNGSGVSSGGSLGLPDGNYNTIPFLFGRGTMIHKDPTSTSAYSPRQQGLTVRATAIAAAGDISFDGGKTSYSVGRVKVAGRLIPSADIPGITPFALTRQAWHDGITSVTVDSVDGFTLRSLGGEVGRTISPTPPDPLVIGEQIEPDVVTWRIDPSLYHYVPIYSSPTDTTIIGFGYVDWHVQPDGSIQLTPSQNRVAYGNATATLAAAISAGASPDSITEIFRQHAGQPANPPDPTEPEFDNPLYAPVLVNHYIGPQQTNP